MEDLKTEYEIDEDFSFPIQAGEKIGTLYVKNGEKTIVEAPLTVEHSIEKASFFTLFKRALQEMTVFE